MAKQEFEKPINAIQGLIGEYESKTDNPTLEGFSMWLERKKQYALQEYEMHLIEKKYLTERRERNGKAQA